MSTLMDLPSGKTKREVLDQAVIRFAGDSGDGMQITGSQFTNTVALYGNDIATFPDYPAEIRAPAGTVPGVSGFQLNFSSGEVYTPGDSVDVLVAMNPAALKVNLADLKANGILIVNSDSFEEADLRKAHVTSNPLEDNTLDKFRVFPVELQRLTRTALAHLGLDAKSMDRCKNFFALGMCYWLYNRSMEPTVRWIDDKFSKKAVALGSQQAGAEGRIFLLRGDRSVSDQLRNPAGAAHSGNLSEPQRQSGAGHRLRHCGAESGPEAVPRQLSHHAGLGHFA